jgi:hypothetical protein
MTEEKKKGCRGLARFIRDFAKDVPGDLYQKLESAAVELDRAAEGKYDK